LEDISEEVLAGYNGFFNGDLCAMQSSASQLDMLIPKARRLANDAAPGLVCITCGELPFNVDFCQDALDLLDMIRGDFGMLIVAVKDWVPGDTISGEGRSRNGTSGDRESIETPSDVEACSSISEEGDEELADVEAIETPSDVEACRRVSHRSMRGTSGRLLDARRAISARSASLLQRASSSAGSIFVTPSTQRGARIISEYGDEKDILTLLTSTADGAMATVKTELLIFIDDVLKLLTNVLRCSSNRQLRHVLEEVEERDETSCYATIELSEVSKLYIELNILQGHFRYRCEDLSVGLTNDIRARLTIAARAVENAALHLREIKAHCVRVLASA